MGAPHRSGLPVSYSTYSNRGCRCDGCREASNIARAATRAANEAAPAATVPHGGRQSSVGLVDISSEWVQHGACRDADTDLFFPEERAHADEARAFCDRCTVREECLNYALANGLSDGVWGGTSARQRRALVGGHATILSASARDRIAFYRRHGWTIDELAQQFGVTIRTVYRVLDGERAKCSL